MSPEADLHLQKARQELRKARTMLDVGLADEAGRAAYLAAFHAAQALIFERTGRTPKTHQGVRGQFARLAVQPPAIDPNLRRFLARGYDLKSIADYGIGADAVVPEHEAAEAIDTAAAFVDAVVALLPTN